MAGKIQDGPDEVPSTSDARDLAMSISRHPDVAGAICIVLTHDGKLRIGMGMVDEETTKSVMTKLAKVLKDACDNEWSVIDSKSTGVFVDDSKQN